MVGILTSDCFHLSKIATPFTESQLQCCAHLTQFSTVGYHYAGTIIMQYHHYAGYHYTGTMLAYALMQFYGFDTGMYYYICILQIDNEPSAKILKQNANYNVNYGDSPKYVLVYKYITGIVKVLYFSIRISLCNEFVKFYVVDYLSA